MATFRLYEGIQSCTNAADVTRSRPYVLSNRAHRLDLQI
jgi:hypothetical protein